MKSLLDMERQIVIYPYVHVLVVHKYGLAVKTPCMVSLQHLHAMKKVILKFYVAFCKWNRYVITGNLNLGYRTGITGKTSPRRGNGSTVGMMRYCEIKLGRRELRK